MLSAFPATKRVCRWATLVLAGGVLAACIDETVAPARDGDDPPREVRVLGVAELTFEGIGTADFSSGVIMAPTLQALEALRAKRERSGDLRDLVAKDLTFPTGGNGTIQLAQPQRNRFVHDSVRYLSTSFRVRNAQTDGTPYNSARNNLTFFAVATNNTLFSTALSKLELADGTSEPALAPFVMPTARVELSGDSLVVPDPDVLQFVREAELTALSPNLPPGVSTVFPYGFVVRRDGDNTTRTLLGSPGDDDFDGVIDFAFSIPQQPDPADDPEKLSVLLLAVDNSVTQVTQGFEQQTATTRAALQQRATSLSADTVTLLPGGGAAAGTFGLRTLCSVRTAGGPGGVELFLVNIADFQSFSPTPNSIVPTNTAFEATFAEPAYGIGPNNLAVRGLQSGPAFLDTTYAGNGSTSIMTPQGSFSAGEVVEIALTAPCPQPQIARYHVQGGGDGTFQPQPTDTAGAGPLAVAIGDLDGDGSLDLAIANLDSDNVSVLLNNGNGTFQNQQLHDVGDEPRSIAIGDLDGNGSLDLATANFGSASVSVLLNNGDGTFQNQRTIDPERAPFGLAIADLDGNGSLDLAVTHWIGGDHVSVLLNNGDATFQTPQTNAVGLSPVFVATGDLDADGSLDLIVANGTAIAGRPDSVSVLLNNGDGTFQNQQQVVAANQPQSVATGDLDGNGSLDLAVANVLSNNVSVLLNNGDGTFQNQQLHDVGTEPRSVAVVDLDGNGSLDLVTANETSNNVSVLLNNGNGTFQNQSTFSVGGTGPNSIAIGDLDGNGSPDLVTANIHSNNVSVLLGQMP